MTPVPRQVYVIYAWESGRVESGVTHTDLDMSEIVELVCLGNETRPDETPSRATITTGVETVELVCVEVRGSK